MEAEKKVYFSVMCLRDGNFKVEWSEENKALRMWVTDDLYVTIPHSQIKKYRDEWRKLLAIVGDVLQDIDIMEEGKNA